MKVIEFDRAGKRIVLSVEAYYRGREKTELEAFLAKHPTKTLKVEEIVEERPKLDVERKPEEKVDQVPPPVESPKTETEEVHEPQTQEEPTPEAGEEKKEEISPPAEPLQGETEETPKAQIDEKPKDEGKPGEGETCSLKKTEETPEPEAEEEKPEKKEEETDT